MSYCQAITTQVQDLNLTSGCKETVYWLNILMTSLENCVFVLTVPSMMALDKAIRWEPGYLEDWIQAPSPRWRDLAFSTYTLSWPVCRARLT